MAIRTQAHRIAKRALLPFGCPVLCLLHPSNCMLASRSVSLPLCMFVFPVLYPFVYNICLSLYFVLLSNRISVDGSLCLPAWRSLCMSVSLFVQLPANMSLCLAVCQSIDVCVCVFACLFCNLSVCPSVSLSVSISVCLSVYLCLSLCLSLSVSVCLSVCVCLTVYLLPLPLFSAWILSYSSAMLPHSTAFSSFPSVGILIGPTRTASSAAPLSA